MKIIVYLESRVGEAYPSKNGGRSLPSAEIGGPGAELPGKFENHKNSPASKDQKSLKGGMYSETVRCESVSSES